MLRDLFKPYAQHHLPPNYLNAEKVHALLGCLAPRGESETKVINTPNGDVAAYSFHNEVNPGIFAFKSRLIIQGRALDTVLIATKAFPGIYAIEELIVDGKKQARNSRERLIALLNYIGVNRTRAISLFDSPSHTMPFPRPHSSREYPFRLRDKVLIPLFGH